MESLDKILEIPPERKQDLFTMLIEILENYPDKGFSYLVDEINGKNTNENERIFMFYLAGSQIIIHNIMNQSPILGALIAKVANSINEDWEAKNN